MGRLWSLTSREGQVHCRTSTIRAVRSMPAPSGHRRVQRPLSRSTSPGTSTMRRTLLALTPAILAGLVFAPAVPAEAAPAVKIYLTHFDSYGSKKDDYTNASLN